MHKSPFYSVKIEFFWYHGFNGNKVHVSKTIKFILIKAHLHIPNLYNFRKNKLKIEKRTTMLRSYENIAQF